jgi:DNA-binding CsgD family transcriptional regulator/tetratricopeptide (TPR) repeat protein
MATYDTFSTLDSAEPLTPPDLELFATAAYMLGKVTEMLATQERAYHAYIEVGEPLLAARTALWLATNLASRGKIPQASGWVEVSERLLQSAPEDCVERGYLLMPRMLRHVMADELEDVVEVGGRAADIGRRFGDLDLTALTAQTQARALLRLSRTAEGLRLLDEVMISVTGSRLSPMVTGLVYCSVLEGCYETHAIKRAAVWTQSLTDWCGEQPDLVAFNDQCLAHRSEILRLQGSWIEAEEEAHRAGMAGARFQIAAQAHYQIGEIKRMRGDLAAAEQTYRQVSHDGGDPMPGIALLRLAQGNADAAFTTISDALAEATDPFVRIQLLPAVVEIAIGADHIPEATEATRELSEAADATGTEVHLGWAEHAEGRVALAEKRITQAIVHLRRAKAIWQDLSMLYDLARTRVDLGRALRARGGAEAADLEYEAARAVFVELGAAPDVRAIDEVVQRSRSKSPAELTDREVEVLQLLLSGATNRSMAASLVLSERTIDRHVSNIFTKIGVTSRSAATAWAFKNGLA